MRVLLVLLCSASMCSFAHAQAYFTTAGIRVGPSTGVSVQQRVLERITGEIVIGHNQRLDETRMMLVGKMHSSLITKNANLFVGGGIHRTIGSAGTDQEKTKENGILAVVGGELTLGRVNISWDYRPSLFLSGLQSRILSAESAVYVRYVLIKRLKDLQKNKRQKRKSNRNQQRRRGR